jgi:uncharacterized membrane protein YfcA
MNGPARERTILSDLLTDPAAWTLAFLAAVTVGLSKGGLPVVGMLAVPLLALEVNAVAAAGLLLPIYIISDMFGLYAYRRAFSRDNLLILVPATAIGVLFGWATASVTPERMVTLLIGVIGLVFALNNLIRRGDTGPAKRPAWGPGLFWGALTGFTSFVSHAGAPPYQVFVQPQRLEKLAYAGTSTILFAWVNAIKLPAYWSLGQVNSASLKVTAILALPAVISVFAGFRLVNLIPQELFYKLITWALLLVSLRLIWQAGTG